MKSAGGFDLQASPHWRRIRNTTVNCRHGSGNSCVALFDMESGRWFARSVAMSFKLASWNLVVVGWFVHWSLIAVGILTLIFSGDSLKMMSVCVEGISFLRRTYISYLCAILVAALSIFDLMLFVGLKYGELPYFWFWFLVCWFLFGAGMGGYFLRRLVSDHKVHQIRDVMTT